LPLDGLDTRNQEMRTCMLASSIGTPICWLAVPATDGDAMPADDDELP
jgi:hypothetical protein